MNKEITYEDVEAKYKEVSRYVSHVEHLAFSPVPSKAPWLNTATLARWLYQSAQEWEKDYGETLARFLKSEEAKGKTSGLTNSARDNAIRYNLNNLKSRMTFFSSKLSVLYSQDKLLMEAIK